MNPQTCIETMKTRLATLHPTYIEITDDSAAHKGHHPVSGGHYTLIISASAFAHQSLVKQHQLIYAALGDLLPTAIHALRIQVKP